MRRRPCPTRRGSGGGGAMAVVVASQEFEGCCKEKQRPLCDLLRFREFEDAAKQLDVTVQIASTIALGGSSWRNSRAELENICLFVIKFPNFIILSELC